MKNVLATYQRLVDRFISWLFAPLIEAFGFFQQGLSAHEVATRNTLARLHLNDTPEHRAAIQDLSSHAFGELRQSILYFWYVLAIAIGKHPRRHALLLVVAVIGVILIQLFVPI